MKHGEGMRELWEMTVRQLHLNWTELGGGAQGKDCLKLLVHGLTWPNPPRVRGNDYDDDNDTQLLMEHLRIGDHQTKSRPRVPTLISCPHYMNRPTIYIDLY